MEKSPEQLRYEAAAARFTPIFLEALQAENMARKLSDELAKLELQQSELDMLHRAMILSNLPNGEFTIPSNLPGKMLEMGNSTSLSQKIRSAAYAKFDAKVFPAWQEIMAPVVNVEVSK